MANQVDFIRVEVKAKLFELNKNYYISSKAEIQALKELIKELENKESSN